MLLDFIFVAIVLWALIQGYRRGLIVGVFSFIAIFIGLAAAIKLSTVVAGYIGKSVKASDHWLPLIAFAAVFIIVVLLVRAVALVIDRTARLAMLGWLNRLGGMIFYLALYIIIFSVLLFYAEQLKIVPASAIEKSLSYNYVRPWGPKAIDGFGTILPFFKNMFLELQEFFGNLSHKIT
jgi:membrane protein required for colicin V production